MAHRPQGAKGADGSEQLLPGRYHRLSIDPKAIQAREVAAHGSTRDMEKFTPQMVEEVRDLFQKFDKSGDNELDRSEFGSMMWTLGVHLPEDELNTFFDRMDTGGDGFVEFEELVDFLEEIARPLTLEEELSEAFRFFDPQKPEVPAEDTRRDSQISWTTDSSYSDSDSEEEEEPKPAHPAITAKGLAQALSGMGEEISEEECLDMITAATSGKDVITFEAFREFSKPPSPAPVVKRRNVRAAVESGEKAS